MKEEEIKNLISKLEQLHVESGKTIDEIKRLAGKAATEPEPGTRTNTFKTGDKVYITNRVTTLPIGRRSTTADRVAIVTKASGNQVYFTTANGRETWRSASNLKKIMTEEYTSLAKAT